MLNIQFDGDDIHFRDNLKVLASRSYEIAELSVTGYLNGCNRSTIEVRNPDPIVIASDRDEIRIEGRWINVKHIMKVDVMFALNADRYPNSRKESMGLALAAHIRDYLVSNLGLRYGVALEHAENIDSEAMKYDWIELFNGTTFDKSREF